MNVNKLRKLLQRDKKRFTKLDRYERILMDTAHISINFSNFSAFDTLADKAIELTIKNGLSLPFDNILLDLTGVKLYRIQTNRTKFLLHIVPIEISTDISTFNIMSVQDMYQNGKEIIYNNHIISLDHGTILSTAAVNSQKAGCYCYRKNPLSHGHLLKQIQSFTPIDKNQYCGYTAYNCKSMVQSCKTLRTESDIISRIAIATMAYISIACHQIVRIIGNESKKQNPYYVVCDKEGWSKLLKNEATSYSTFNDGLKFDEFNKLQPFTINDAYDSGSMRFEPIKKTEVLT